MDPRWRAPRAAGQGGRRGEQAPARGLDVPPGAAGPEGAQGAPPAQAKSPAQAMQPMHKGWEAKVPLQAGGKGWNCDHTGQRAVPSAPQVVAPAAQWSATEMRRLLAARTVASGAAQPETRRRVGQQR